MPGMISVVVPCYNEEDSIADVYNSLSASLKNSDYEIVFVNDGSGDSTSDKLGVLCKNDARVIVVTHGSNVGLGKALKTGFENSSGEVIITTDADSTHDASLIPNMVHLIEAGYDVVIGSRYVKGGRMLHVPFYRVVVSKFAGFLFHIILGMWGVNDMTSGYRAYSKKVKEIDFISAGFQAELEILYKMAKAKARITEVPIILEMRKKGFSKFNLAKVAMEYLKLAVNLKLRPSR